MQGEKRQWLRFAHKGNTFPYRNHEASLREAPVCKRLVIKLAPQWTNKMSVFWERGSPDLPACGLRRGSSGGPARPTFISSSSRPSRGAKPRGADDRKLPQRQPHQAGSRGGGEIKAGYLARCPWRKPWRPRAPGGRQRAQCPCFLFGAKEASAGEEFRAIRQRFPYQCNKTKTARTAGRRSSRSPP